MYIRRSYNNIGSSILKVILSIWIITSLGSCQAVKPYQRAYLNDSNMQMLSSHGTTNERYAQSIREGSGGGHGSGKGSGGCGCN